MTQNNVRTAVVSGASGFVASEIVKQLLEKGYNVRGTVRSTGDAAKVAHLMALGESLPGTLELFEADLLKAGSFDAAVAGASYVFHAASPFVRDVEDPQRDLVDPALQGTQNILSSVGKHKDTVKRVVLTSSFAAVHKPTRGPLKKPRYTEEDWNDEATLEKNPYRLSKRLAEQSAWDASRREGFDLVVINPTFVIGPVLSSRGDATSIKDVTGIMEGTSSYLLTWVCDVRDVARAHVLAAEDPAAEGRYIVSQPDTVPVRRLTDALKQRFPGIKIQDGEDHGPKPLVDNSKALKLLGRLHDPCESIIDMATTLIQKGIAKPKTV